ncbi:MAG TPA: hypothetical protein VG477_11685, partial [Thermoanaerobaculia bacterium]|nr:hypothetical protein [Thermoanaerobaculia bacterium]
MAWGKKKSGGNGVAWLALLLAVLALMLAWGAYKRTGGELRDLWGDVTLDTSKGIDLSEVQARLQRSRAEVQGQRNL